MRLIDELNKLIASKPGLFREQLMREDVARLKKLEALARSAAELESYRLAGRKLGWTTLDARTSELGDVLDELLDAVRDATLSPSVAADARTIDAWRALAHLRMERLVGCLGTPLPKRTDEDGD
ncbi:MAG: hypothetical protein ACYCT1_01145 [Steroidobacteraceae bacterium]